MASNKWGLSSTPVPPFYGAFVDDLNTVGGFANWVQDCEHVKCPDCGRPMKYLAKIQSNSVRIAKAPPWSINRPEVRTRNCAVGLSVCLLLVGFGSLPNDGRLGSTINSTAQFFCNGVHMQHSAQFYSTLLSSELGCSSGRRIPDRHFSFVFLQKTLQQAVRNTNQKPRTNQQSFRSRH